MNIDKRKFLDRIDTTLEALKKELVYFYDKDPEYAVKMADWFLETGIKNKFIHQSRYSAGKKDREMVRRRRTRVYYIDFGVNVGSEFNYPHFCVVIAEFKYHALVVPLSTVKETDQGGWKEDSENLFVEIGEVEGFPLETKECYAIVSQMRAVSKQRLSDYKHPETKEFIRLKLTDPQMNAIDTTIEILCTKAR